MTIFVSYMQPVIEQHIDYKNLYEQAQVTIQTLQHELAQIKKLIFGSKHERFIAPSANQVQQASLDLQAEVVAQCKITNAQKIEYTRLTKQTKAVVAHPGRHALPEHLERREQIIEPAQDVTGLKRIGEEVMEELEYEPGKLFVNKIIRPKYARANKEGILIAPMIERPLPKSIFGAGLLAQIIIDKYVDHIPLHRQAERFSREGVRIAYSTLTDAISSGCGLIAPLQDALVKQVLQCDYLHVDETPTPVLDKDKKGKTHKGYYWVYHNSIEGLVLFDYQPGRGREGPQGVLKDFKGLLQTDGYSVYELFKEQQGITVFHCMAHARRKFFDALVNDKARAEYALGQFGLLYEIERNAKEQQLTYDQLLEERVKKAVPILEQLGQWMKEQYTSGKLLPESTIGKALGYSIQRWKELTTYTTDGKLNIDNNPVENSIRPVALGRKNYLFAGSHQGAQRSAMLYSLLGTCKQHDVNPFIWLKDVLQRIATHPINKIEELLPHRWQPHTNS